jgi:sucrose phosphorylase
VGLLAGHNDLDLLRRTGVGRDINRHYYAPGEIEEHLQRPVVQRLISLLEFRNSHPAFHGSFQFECPSGQSVVMEWRRGPDWTRLDVDVTNTRASITCSRPDDTCERPVWHTIPEGQR